VSIAIVGQGTPLKVYDEDGATAFLRLIEGEERRGARPAPEEEAAAPAPADDEPAPAPDPAVAMDTE